MDKAVNFGNVCERFLLAHYNRTCQTIFSQVEVNHMKRRRPTARQKLEMALEQMADALQANNAIRAELNAALINFKETL